MPVSRTPRDLDAARKRRKNLGRRRAARLVIRRRTSENRSWGLMQNWGWPQGFFSRVRVSWRLVSMGLVLLFGALLGYAVTEPSFFVYSIELVDTDFIRGDEIYRAGVSLQGQ